MNEPKTIRIRIAVAVTPDGKWVAHGCSTCGNDDRAIATVDAGISKKGRAGYVVHWVTVDVPLPEPTIIPGRVE